MASPLLSVRGLESHFRVDHGVVRAVDGVSFEVGRGEVVGVVGESGSGKSVTALSILRLLPRPHGRVVKGSVQLDGQELLTLPEAQMRAMRGQRIAMIFQDPMSSLNPYLSVGSQLAEVCELHLGSSRKEAWQRTVELLTRVNIPDAEKRARQYPHELSGGMRQRAMIAMALLCEPELLIADEPTTALDVTIQAQILDLLLELRQERGLSILLITHDLGVVASTCDRVLVMYAGRIVETAPARALFVAPHHPYTRALLHSVPRADMADRSHLTSLEGLPPRLDLGRFEACSFAPRCRYARAACLTAEPELRRTAPDRYSRCILAPEELASTTPGATRSRDGLPVTVEAPSREAPLLEVENLFVHFHTAAGVVRAVDGVDLALARGETLAVVGESGSGKSTLARAIMGIELAHRGSIRFEGRTLRATGPERRALYRHLQLIFQDPEASLNPRLTIGNAIAEPIQIHRRLTRPERRRAVEDLLRHVGLDPALIDRYPHELSGGQRQRVSIARALAVTPRVLILDEAVSALDVSIRAQILNLLVDLQRRFGLAYLFITHDLGVVRYLSHRVAVMYLGQIVEQAQTEALFANPIHPYTRALLDSVPKLDPEAPRKRPALRGDVPSPLTPPSGCRFHTRCPSAWERCSAEIPRLLELGPRRARCFLAEPMVERASEHADEPLPRRDN